MHQPEWDTPPHSFPAIFSPSNDVMLQINRVKNSTGVMTKKWQLHSYRIYTQLPFLDFQTLLGMLVLENQEDPTKSRKEKIELW